MVPQARAFELAQLLARLTLGKQRQVMPRGEIDERRFDVRQQFALALEKMTRDKLDRRG